MEFIELDGSGIPNAPTVVSFGGFCENNKTRLFGQRTKFYCEEEGFGYLSYTNLHFNGSGRDEHVKQLSFQSLVEEVRTVLMKIPDGEKGLIVAYSLWCWIVIKTLEQYPELVGKVGSVVLMAPAWNCMDEPYKKFWVYLKSLNTQAAKQALSNLEGDELVRDSDNRPYKLSFVRSCWQAEIDGPLKFMKMPVTIVQGKLDTIVTVESSKKLLHLMPKDSTKKIVKIADLSHNFEGIQAFEIVRNEISCMVRKYFILNLAGTPDYKMFDSEIWVITPVDGGRHHSFYHRLTMVTFNTKEKAEKYIKNIRDRKGDILPLNELKEDNKKNQPDIKMDEDTLPLNELKKNNKKIDEDTLPLNELKKNNKKIDEDTLPFNDQSDEDLMDEDN